MVNANEEDLSGGEESRETERLAGIAPYRLKGVEELRAIPVLPDPAVDVEATVRDLDDEKFVKWQEEWGGTRPEFEAFYWLERHGYEHDWDFDYQSSRMGGRQMFGGAVVDFDFPSILLAWRIQGEHWHVGDPAKEAKDEMQKLSLSQYGYTVVDIYAQDCLSRPDWVFSNAIIGIQVRSLAEGSV